MKRDHVRGFEKFFQRQERVCGPVFVADVIVLQEHRLHAETVLADRGHGLADGALADDAEAAAMEVVDGMVEKAELRRFLPFAPDHVLAVADDGPPKGQDQGEGMLGHRMDGVSPDVGDDNAVGLAIVQVDDIGAGGGDGDHLQVRALSQGLGPEWHLVVDDDGRVFHAFGDFIGAGAVVFGPLVIEIRPPDLDVRGDGVAVEKDDVMGHERDLGGSYGIHG